MIRQIFISSILGFAVSATPVAAQNRIPVRTEASFAPYSVEDCQSRGTANKPSRLSGGTFCDVAPRLEDSSRSRFLIEGWTSFARTADGYEIQVVSYLCTSLDNRDCSVTHHVYVSANSVTVVSAMFDPGISVRTGTREMLANFMPEITVLRNRVDSFE